MLLLEYGFSFQQLRLLLIYLDAMIHDEKLKEVTPLCHLYAMVIEKGKRGDPLKASERCLLEFNENVHQKYAQVYI